MTPTEAATKFIEAVQAKDGAAAAALCADDVEVLLPGADAPLKGKAGVRQLILMAPQFQQSFRDAREDHDVARITTLTRAPGIFANYTTWNFETGDGLIRRLTFELRAAN